MKKSSSKTPLKFTQKNIAKIEYINQILDQKTRLAYSLAKHQEENLLELMKIPGSFVSDYEINFRLSLFSNNKPEGLDDSFFEDNYAISFRKMDRFTDYNEYDEWLLNENHNEFQFGNGLLSKQIHCWLFHHLYHHTHLTWHDIICIDEIWLEVIVTFQNLSELH